MAEIIMTFALGFLIASGIALALAAPLWKRAASITQKRLRASSPVSLDDFNADKDRMRAEFAMSARKLEMSVESLRKKAETRLAELDKREREVAALNERIEEKAGQSAKQSEEIALLKQRLSDSDTLLARRDEEMKDLRAKLSEAQNVLARQSVAIREANSLVEGQRADIDSLAQNVESKASELVKKAAALEERDAQLANCGKAVAEQKMAVGELKRERVKLTRRIEELESTHGDTSASYAEALEREASLKRERDEALRSLDAAHADIAALKAQSQGLAREYEERAQWERRESALMRERLGDLAIEVERASGTIDALVEPNGESGAELPVAADAALVRKPGFSLAQRIRALGSLSTH